MFVVVLILSHELCARFIGDQQDCGALATLERVVREKASALIPTIFIVIVAKCVYPLSTLLHSV